MKYAVRISATAANVRPDCPAFYPRTHWAIETMLSQPEFKDLQWTSLQPNGFLPMFLWPAAEFVRQYRETKKQGTLSMMIDAGTPTGLIDSSDVGIIAAHLVSQDDTTPHNHAKYVLNGPEDVTGNQVVELIEQYIGEKVEKVSFQDLSMIDHMAEQSSESKNLILTIKQAPVTMWQGRCKASTTSKEILELYAPKRTYVDVLKALLN